MTQWKERVLALDVGEKRIGVAVSDPLGLTAQGVETIHTRGAEKDRERVRELLRQYGTDRLIVGLPRNLRGEEGFQAERVRNFVNPLLEEGVRVRFVDERMTSVLANRTLREAGVRGDRRRRYVDMLAAEEILTTFLDAGGWRE